MAEGSNSNRKRYRSIQRSIDTKKQSTFGPRQRKLTANKKIVITDKKDGRELEGNLILSPSNIMFDGKEPELFYTVETI